MAEIYRTFTQWVDEWGAVSITTGLQPFQLELIKTLDNLEGGKPKPMIIFQNKTFCLTGKLHRFTRNEARRLIVLKGGRLDDGVTNKTDYLIVGESPGNKLAKAVQKGYVTIINDDEFTQAIMRKDANEIQTPTGVARIMVSPTSEQIPERKNRKFKLG